MFDLLDEDTVLGMLKKHAMKAKGLSKYVEKSAGCVWLSSFSPIAAAMFGG